MTCPNCGRKLAKTKLGKGQPPYLCAPCSRGWWKAELDAAAYWDPTTRDFGLETPLVIAAAEREAGLI